MLNFHTVLMESRPFAARVWNDRLLDIPINTTLSCTKQLLRVFGLVFFLYSCLRLCLFSGVLSLGWKSHMKSNYSPARVGFVHVTHTQTQEWREIKTGLSTIQLIREELYGVHSIEILPEANIYQGEARNLNTVSDWWSLCFWVDCQTGDKLINIPSYCIYVITNEWLNCIFFIYISKWNLNSCWS